MTEQITLESKIQETIERDIRPYIEMDGGHITFIEVKDHIVYVELSGACGTCPSATMTLKGGVERIIKRKFPDIIRVELAGFRPM